MEFLFFFLFFLSIHVLCIIVQLVFYTNSSIKTARFKLTEQDVAEAQEVWRRVGKLR